MKWYETDQSMCMVRKAAESSFTSFPVGRQSLKGADIARYLQGVPLRGSQKV